MFFLPGFEASRPLMSNIDLDTLEFGESLGKGSSGEVFALTKDNERRVVKQYAAMAIDRRLLGENYDRLLAMPSQDGIAQVHKVRFDTPPYLAVMDRVEGVPLNTMRVGKEARAWMMIRQLTETLGEAHKRGVFHGHIHDGNIFVSGKNLKSKDDAPEVIVTDFGAGLVGEVHHIDVGESTYFAAPEQLISGGAEWKDGGVQRWDVYSFGVLAYRMINGRFPRGSKYLKARDKQMAASGGRPVPVNPGEYLDHVVENPEVSWGKSFGLSEEFKLYREIIDQCLELDPSKRPVDLREVRNQFRTLQHRFALEDAEERVLKERRKQKAKLFGARAVACCLGISFLGATYYLVDYLRKTYFFQNKVTELDQVVLTQRAQIDHLDERWAQTVTDLKKSREAADSFFQRMAQGDNAGGSGVASLRKEDLMKSRDYYLKTLDDVKEDGETGLEKGRALHSLAHIERKMGMNEVAIEHFQNSIDVLSELTDTHRDDKDIYIDINVRLADSYENVSSLVDNPVGNPALTALNSAVEYFDKVIALRPDDISAVTRQAGINFKLGSALDAHERYDEAIEAYSKSAELAEDLKENSENDASLTELVGKLQFQVARSLKMASRTEEAIDAHIAAMETVEELRGVNGFSPLQSIQMASSFLDLGELFKAKEASSSDLDQLYNEALRLLTPLNTANPEDVEVAMLLCRSLTRLGELEREEARWSSGYRLSVRGIEALKVALDANPQHVEGRILLAEARMEHLDFLEKEKQSAVAVALKGVEVAESAKELLSDEELTREPERSQMKRRLVALFSQYGDVCKELGETEAAKRCYDLSKIEVGSL